MLNKFFEYLEFEKKYAKHTLVAYQSDLRAFTEFLKTEFDTDQLTSVSYPLIRSWIIHLSELNYSTSSINRKLTAVKAYYNFLLKLGEITVNPMQKHKALKQAKKQQLAFSKTEVSEVMKVFDTSTFSGTRDQLVVDILYQTGIRRQELLNLDRSSIDFNSGQLKILGKRNKERYIPIKPSLTNLINDYMQLLKDESVKSNKLILTNTYQAAYPNLIYRIVQTYFKRVSAKQKCSPHIIRHSFATHLLENGADLIAIKELMGHSSLASTQHYTKTNMSRLKTIINTKHPRSKKDK
ncbi:tyrosine-type recombinase/integrase [Psychroflexus sp. ALD_RP9]|uniref:tyrosine-type recombinase/integrase n=1 Tax=Psychroflexus sp. ALD_RP9 TaxID=2777186 RepID=UPI001A8DD989|nr:tyrosine-type recombinase/integrase [Psychroflexus sp. ALD_RP9]QSS96425.1 tyrosine-type recombinase/integrase [Psychroflexus sp. ALD_RP9]